MTPTTIIEREIRDAVAGRGYGEAAIARQYVKDRVENHGTDGEWFCLFVDGQLWGRRRTTVELLAMAQRGPIF